MENRAEEREPLRLAIARAKDAVRLLDARLNPESKRRRWEMPECVRISILKALHPEMGEREIANGIESGRLEIPNRNVYLSEAVRRAALVSFVDYMRRMGKEPRMISDHDFRRNGLGGLVNNWFGSCSGALRWAGALSEDEVHAFRFKSRPWTFSNRENRIRALREEAKRIGKEPRETKLRDLGDGIRIMVINYYNGSVFEAFLDAGLVTKKDEEYMRAQTEKMKRKIARDGG